MARDPRSRDELRRRLDDALGQEAAETLMEALPPHPWDELATKQDIAALIDQLKEWVELKIEASEHRSMATLHRELAAQMRTMMFSQVGVVLSTATAVIAAAKLL